MSDLHRLIGALQQRMHLPIQPVQQSDYWSMHQLSYKLYDLLNRWPDMPDLRRLIGALQQRMHLPIQPVQRSDYWSMHQLSY